MGAAETRRLWVRGCSGARRRPRYQRIELARLRRGPGLVSSYELCSQPIPLVCYWTLAGLTFRTSDAGLRHPLASTASGAHSIRSG